MGSVDGDNNDIVLQERTIASSSVAGTTSTGGK
jgi:hypothetical protein